MRGGEVNYTWQSATGQSNKNLAAPGDLKLLGVATKMTFLWVALTSLVLLDVACGCGNPSIKPNVKASERIINGVNAIPGSWPWQVSLQVSPSTPDVFQVITNPSWDSYKINNDVALLKLSSPVKLSTYVSPVCLASSNEVLPAGLKCATTGWGRDKLSSSEPAVILQQVSLPLVPVNECQKQHSNPITTSMICAGGAGSTSCHGDSGGPLVCQKGSTWYLIGIVSWGSPSCNVRTPAVYTRVSKFRNWIDQVVARN
ncbi:chymotrypsin-like protease CTRL-1 [Vipera latastei]